MTEHIRLTSADFADTQDLVEDAVLDANDPILDMKKLAGITSNNNVGKLQEYSGYGSVKTEGSNCSITAMEKINYQQDNNVQPGSPEWFRLWFTRPFLTNTTPF